MLKRGFLALLLGLAVCLPGSGQGSPSLRTLAIPATNSVLQAQPLTLLVRAERGTNLRVRTGEFVRTLEVAASPKVQTFPLGSVPVKASMTLDLAVPHGDIYASISYFGLIVGKPQVVPEINLEDFPNPLKSRQVNIDYSLTVPASTTGSFQRPGRPRQKIFGRPDSAGNHRYVWPAQSLKRGTYTVYVQGTAPGWNGEANKPAVLP